MTQEFLTISTHHGDQSDKPSKTHPSAFSQPKKYIPKIPVFSSSFFLWNASLGEIAMVSTTKQIEIFCSPQVSITHLRQLAPNTALLIPRQGVSRFTQDAAGGILCHGIFAKKKRTKTKHDQEALEFPPGLLLQHHIPWMD